MEGITVTCFRCHQTINNMDNVGLNEEDLCKPCFVGILKENREIICPLCNKMLGHSVVYCNLDKDEFAHEDCVKKLPKDEQDDWSEDWE